MKPRIGITIGDPAGIGPEIVLKALSHPAVKRLCRPVVFGNTLFLSRVAARVLRKKYLPPAEYFDVPGAFLPGLSFGKITAWSGRASGLFIAEAVRAALSGEIDAVVTAPINKQSFRLGGWGKRFTGHTEMLAGLTGARRVALMLVHGCLRAVHVTSHVPLKKVSAALTRARVLETISLTHAALRRMGFARPRIAVCGFNPHAGENGLLGDEERRVIAPAVAAAKRNGIRAEGPLSADSVWPLVLAGVYDVGVAMYHDQGQIPIKLLSFKAGPSGTQVRGINITLGLPIIRTSVAHGTAYEIAGKGTASDASLVDAICLAVTMAKRKI